MTPNVFGPCLLISALILSPVMAAERPRHPCTRACTTDQEPRRCHYKFVIEDYSTMSDMCYNCPTNLTDCYRPACVAADGWPRTMLSINRQMPGPSIQVCEGDEIIVDVNNQIRTESTTIHWHGLYQHYTPYMDGVPMVTQCPIPPGTTFRYKFPADRAGTSYYHSHLGPQRGNGLYGALVVRRPPMMEPNIYYYDYDLPEHVIVLADWNRDPAKSNLGVLINGRGSNKTYPGPNGQQFMTPREDFLVEAGQRYRFRILNNGITNCPLEMSVDNHQLLVIATDGNAIVPVTVDSFILGSGERVDFVLKANQTVRNYWIKVRGLVQCGNPQNAFQYAILRYVEAFNNSDPPGEVSYAAAGRNGTQLNPVGVVDATPTLIPIKTLTARVDDDESLKPDPDYQMYLDIQNKVITPKDFDPLTYPLLGLSKTTARYNPINDITFTFPSFPPLTQPEKIKSDTFCNSHTIDQEYCRTNVCRCPHLVEFNTDAVIEFILVSTGSSILFGNHPIHQHGYSFRVVSTGFIGANITVDQVRQLDQNGQIHRRLHKSPRKDTLLIPGGGYAIIRLLASNPGYWLLHCHISDHLAKGMVVILKIGQQYEMPSPPWNFPKC